MSFAFACTKENEQGPERTHETSGVMRQCPRCNKWAVAGYQCQEEDCQHEEIDPADRLAGHGEGKCELAEVSA